MQREAFIELLGRQRATAILRTKLTDTAAHAMHAAVRGGFRICEFTLTTPNAYELIQEFASLAPGAPGTPGVSTEPLVVGAGTVLTAKQAEQAVQSGASFLVSPVVDESVIDAATALGVAVMPGCHTPTEMLRAHNAGAPLQKLFPAPGNGPAYIRSCLGPLPFLKIVPTNGVDATNVQEFLAAGAYAVGFVNPLFDPQSMAARDFDAIQRKAQQLLAAVASA